MPLFIAAGGFNNHLQALIEGSAGQQDSASTTGTHESDVRTKSYDSPLVAAARVLLAQTNDIAQMDFNIHKGVIIAYARWPNIGGNGKLRMPTGLSFLDRTVRRPLCVASPGML